MFSQDGEHLRDAIVGVKTQIAYVRAAIRK